MKYKVAFFSVFILMVLQFVFPILGLNNYQDLTQENIAEINKYQSREDNPNNIDIVSYPDGLNYIGLGNNMSYEVVEDELNGQQFIVPARTTYFYGLKPGFDHSDAVEQIPFNYFTLYDVTDNNKIIETIEVPYDDDLSYGSNEEGENTVIDCQTSVDVVFDAEGLDDFHEYKIGVNLSPGDDLNVYTSEFHLARPELTEFSTTSTDDSIVIDYELTNPTSTVTFDYNELYIEVKGKRTNLDADQERVVSGSITIDHLKQATEYDVVLGYDLTKTVTSDIQYDIDHEFNFAVSTKVPSDYIGGDVVAIATILLFILLVILLILIIVILYWNYQRRKISGMTLVVGEDTQTYDPVYQHNYHQQEDESGIPNTTSSNQGDEVYGYFDDVQDNQEEPYGYFDEVYDDTENGIHDYENPHEDFNDMEEF